MKAVAYLLDKQIWTDKFKCNGAKYVVGGPSLEMVFDSYNQYTNQSNMYQSRAENSTGYKLSDDSGTTWNYYSSSSSKYLTLGDNLYRISSQNNSSAYWVSSPSSCIDTYVIFIAYNGNVAYTIYRGTSSGFRPIVCLKSGTSLKEIEEGKSYQI